MPYRILSDAEKPSTITIDDKDCSSCKRRLHWNQFSFDRRRADGLQASCKMCHNTVQKKYFAAKKERAQKPVQEESSMAAPPTIDIVELISSISKTADAGLGAPRSNSDARMQLAAYIIEQQFDIIRMLVSA